MRYDLLLRGAHLIDPAAGVDGRRDVAFASGRVAAVDAAIPPASARQVVELGGAYLAPGLIDLHAHAFIAGHDLGIDTDAVCRATGVTTLCDAGSAGAAAFPGLREYVIARADTRVLAFVHLAAIGLSHLAIGEHCYLAYSDPALAAATAREHREVALGIKVRIQAEVVGEHGLEPLRRGIQAADAAGLPVIVHVNNPPVEYAEVLALLRPGDIVSHFLHGRGSGILDAQGQVKDAVRAARRRGVLFDVAHGRNHVNFGVTRAALAQGFLPDSISSDLTRPGRAGVVRDLPTTLSKFLSLGMPLGEVVRAATAGPARAIGRAGELGTLAVGAAGDAAAFVVEEGRFAYQDADGNTLEGDRRWEPRLTVRAGRVSWSHPG
ncbi:MAG TPA: amidohydrolase/deacetylase family metallohydrolase [Methylomirabilota bacterium]|jgi:dihydroorotase|nr:amidohydrolase/deacetylase family metallohydrolase [Methylomirabilota bacterium]